MRDCTLYLFLPFSKVLLMKYFSLFIISHLIPRWKNIYILFTYKQKGTITSGCLRRDIRGVNEFDFWGFLLQRNTMAFCTFSTPATPTGTSLSATMKTDTNLYGLRRLFFIARQKNRHGQRNKSRSITMLETEEKNAFVAGNRRVW